MVKVAIAGCGGVGRAIIEALKEQNEHEYIILSRNENPALETELGVKIIKISYTDVTSAQKTLEDRKIHTVISTIGIGSEEVSQAQITLIKAADAAGCVKRFAPSEFGIPYEERHATAFPIVSYKLAARAALSQTNLEYTLFSNGFFMDYLGMPKVKSYVMPLTIGIDFPHKTAAIPGKGETPVVWTYTMDVGRFVVKSLGLESWGRGWFSVMVGDRKSWGEILEVGERVTGSKFKTTYDPIEKLRKGEVTELPSHVQVYPFFPKQAMQGMLALFGAWFENGDFDFKASKGESLNEKFPEIKTKSVEQIIAEGWS